MKSNKFRVESLERILFEITAREPVDIYGWHIVDVHVRPLINPKGFLYKPRFSNCRRKWSIEFPRRPCNFFRNMPCSRTSSKSTCPCRLWFFSFHLTFYRFFFFIVQNGKKWLYNNFLECNWKQEKACRKKVYREMFRKKKKEKWNQFIRDKI